MCAFAEVRVDHGKVAYLSRLAWDNAEIQMSCEFNTSISDILTLHCSEQHKFVNFRLTLSLRVHESVC